jgi:hypothetical protein
MKMILKHIKTKMYDVSEVPNNKKLTIQQVSGFIFFVQMHYLAQASPHRMAQGEHASGVDET